MIKLCLPHLAAQESFEEDNKSWPDPFQAHRWCWLVLNLKLHLLTTLKVSMEEDQHAYEQQWRSNCTCRSAACIKAFVLQNVCSLSPVFLCVPNFKVRAKLLKLQNMPFHTDLGLNAFIIVYTMVFTVFQILTTYNINFCGNWPGPSPLIRLTEFIDSICFYVTHSTSKVLDTFFKSFHYKWLQHGNNESSTIIVVAQRC